MNKIKFLICFALLVSGVEGRGQIYINSYRFGGIAADLVLDSFPGAEAAFSLRLLDKDYTGNCIMVRKTGGGNDSTNIGFSGSYLDTVALKNFCGTTSTDTCWVRTWYDQSGNARNAQQTTNANQPVILRGGIIFYKNNTPSLDFDGTNDLLTIPSSTSVFNFLHNGSSSAVFSLQHHDIGTTNSALGNNGGGSSKVGFGLYIDATYKLYADISRGGAPFAASIVSANNAIANNSLILSFLMDADNATAANRLLGYINGSSTSFGTNSQSSTASTANATHDWQIGSVGTSTFPTNGGFKEIIIYNGDQTSNRTSIRNNINTFYSIY